MSELTTGQLIKIILGVFVVVAVVVALALIFYPKIQSFFINLPGNSGFSNQDMQSNGPSSNNTQIPSNNVNPSSFQSPQINLIPLNIQP